LIAAAVQRRRVALYGKTGVVKTTVARYLAEHHGFQICNTGRMCRAVSQLIFGDDAKVHLHAVTDALRTIDQAIFLKTALREVTLKRPVVIDAIRFHADLNYARANGFYTMRLDADDAKRKMWLHARQQEFDFELNGRHSAELELSYVIPDAVVENGSSIEALNQRCLEVLRSPLR